MSDTIDLAARGYRFIPGVMQYSGGVAALPGFRLERVRFADPVPMRAGFAAIAAWLAGEGLAKTSFCACELRSPAPFTEEGFRAFNTVYAGVLGEWGVLVEGRNPVARSNVCPEVAPPAEPGFHAFVVARPEAHAAPSFAVAGSGECPEGHANYQDHMIAPGDVSPKGLRLKVDWVLGEMERRMGKLGFGWAATTGVQAYTVHDVAPFLADAFAPRGALRHGLTWQLCRPPVVGLEFEMDVRGIAVERVIAA
jgi:hypothetical protein